MEDYRNSNKAKAEREAAKQSPPAEKQNLKVTHGKVEVKKKSAVQRFANTFIQEDAKTVKDYVVKEVITPGIKNIVSDIVKNGLDMFFWGKSGKNRPTSPASRVQYNNYSGIYSSQQRAQARMNQQRSQEPKSYYYNTLTFKDRNDAVAVLERMREQLGVYLMVSVADLNDFAGVTGTYTDNKYGWTDLSTASVVNVPGEGWIIDLPKAIVLE